MIELWIRPGSWNLPLFVHVAGAFALVGSLVLVSGLLLLGWSKRADEGASAALERLAFRWLLVAVIPSWIVMRAGAQWIASKEGLENSKDTWIGIGFGTADVGGIVLLVATLIAALAARRARAGRGGALRSATAVLTLLLVVAYAVTIWAMAAKPS